MEKFQDLSRFGYQIVKLIAATPGGYSQTFEASSTLTQQSVFITKTPKEYHLSKDYFFRSFVSSAIPTFIESFVQEDAFYVVREYQKGFRLSDHSIFTLAESRAIALQILDLLCSFEDYARPIAHGNVNPDNIWVFKDGSDDIKIYLLNLPSPEELKAIVDDRTEGWRNLSILAPEHLGMDNALQADLYCLGVVLFALVTGTPFSQIHHFSDPSDPFTLRLGEQAKKLNCQFLDLIKILTASNLNKRVPSPRIAYALAEAIDINAQIELSVDPPTLDLRTSPDNVRIETYIRLNGFSNVSLLEGRIRVKPHPSDSLVQEKHSSFIHLSQEEFCGNDTLVRLTIDAYSLKPNVVYKREIEIWSNARRASVVIPVTITTDQSKHKIKKQPILLLSALWICLSLVPFYPSFIHQVFFRADVAISMIFGKQIEL
jgi:hypothetical protein